jgi:sensor histidine kinase YesM
MPVAAQFSLLLVLSGRLPWTSAVAVAAPLCLLYAFLCPSSWFICRAYPLHETRFSLLAGIHLIAAFLSASLWVLAGKVWVSVLDPVLQISKYGAEFRLLGWLLLGAGMLLYLLCASMHYVMITFELSREAERRSLELRILAREAELKALRAQIDPHFLFNCLNSISALTSSDPEQARKMCLLLSGFLRKSLEAGSEKFIPLKDEIALVSSFLEIERVRLGPRLRVERKIDPRSDMSRVPPLILQPLVENAVQHGIAHLLEGGCIEIETRLLGERLRITIANPCDPDRPRARQKGIGLENVRRRLATMHGPDARLAVENSPEQYRVEISMPAYPDTGERRGP